MTHLNITIDGETIMDGDLGKWETAPPKLESLINDLKTNRNPSLWLRCLLLIVADSGMTGASRVITIQTENEDVWTLRVHTSK